MKSAKDVINKFKEYLDVLGEYLNDSEADIEKVRKELLEAAGENEELIVDMIISNVQRTREAMMVVEFMNLSIGGIYHE